jgi:hypothetical protein
VISGLMRRWLPKEGDGGLPAETTVRPQQPLSQEAEPHARLVLNALYLKFSASPFTTQDAKTCLRDSLYVSEARRPCACGCS